MTAPDDTDERYSITIKGEIYLLVSQYTSNPPTSLVDDIEHLITLHTQEAVAEVIGEDETDDMTDENTKPVHTDWLWRNELRAEQRAKAYLTNPTEKKEA